MTENQVFGLCCVSRTLGFPNASRGFANELHDDLGFAQQPYGRWKAGSVVHTKPPFKLTTITCSQARLFSFLVLAQLCIARAPSAIGLSSITSDLHYVNRRASTHSADAVTRCWSYRGIRTFLSLQCSQLPIVNLMNANGLDW